MTDDDDPLLKNDAESEMIRAAIEQGLHGGHCRARRGLARQGR
jgi:hypothetical protein